MTRYRYLLDVPPPAPTYGRLGRGIRWGLLLALPAWLLIFPAGCAAARLFTP